jgi:hypothetical protein
MVLALAVGRAQDGGQIDEETKLETSRRATNELRRQLTAGQITFDINNQKHVDAIDIEVKLLTYPLIYRSNELDPPRPPNVTTPSFTPAKVLLETYNIVEGQLAKMANPRFRANFGELPSVFSRQLVIRTRDVMINGKPIVTLNAARILALVPAREAGQSEREWRETVLDRLKNNTAEELLSTCADLISADPKKFNDGARIYLLRAAHDTLAMPQQKPPLYKPETAEKVVKAAMEVATRKVTFPQATPRGEVEGFKILRAEALRVLSQSPVVRFEKGSPALLLAQTAANDQSISPPPRTEEFKEAAIGLALHLQRAQKMKDANFQADFAAQQIARAVSSFGKAAEANLESKGLSRQRPWKVDAAKMLEAIDPLRNVKDAYVSEVGKRCRAVLVDIMNDRIGQANVLGNWADSNPPASTTLFKNDPASTVKPRGEADE